MSWRNEGKGQDVGGERRGQKREERQQPERTELKLRSIFNIQSRFFFFFFCKSLSFPSTLRRRCGSGLTWKPHLGIEKGVQQHVVGLQVQVEEGRSQAVEEVYA